MQKSSLPKILLPIFLVFFIVGCITIPKGFLKLPEDALEKKQLQSRQFDTVDTTQIISATAGVLQDMGFILDESETEIGLVVASRKCDAKDGGQMFGAFLLDVICAVGGTYSNASAQVDAVQDVRAAIIVKPTLNNDKTVVRVNFQRIVWSVSNQINRLETISDSEMYKTFFEKLSKSVFLEAHEI